MANHILHTPDRFSGQESWQTMYIREYGKDNDRILLFFPGSCEPWEEHAYAAKALAAWFYVLQVVPELNTEIQFWIGEDEWGSRYRDLKWFRKYLPQIKVVKIPRMMHGEFVMMHPQEFAEKVLAFCGETGT